MAPLEKNQNILKSNKVDPKIIKYYEERFGLFCNEYVKEHVD